MAQTTVTAEIVKDADNVVFLRCLIDNTNGDTLAAATASVRILDSAGSELGGVTWPQPMTALGDGDYRADIPDTLIVSVGQEITIEVTADDGPGRSRIFNEDTTVKEG
ncbi:MAG: hypothetical protein GY778_28835 [bacterium]|nr:hypothetical protein [bacterium]